jgi:hypothetical protein
LWRWLARDSSEARSCFNPVRIKRVFAHLVHEVSVTLHGLAIQPPAADTLELAIWHAAVSTQPPQHRPILVPDSPVCHRAQVIVGIFYWTD